MSNFSSNELITLTIFGLVFGSFMNMLIYRLPKSLSILPRSSCTKCKHTLGIYDLIPIVSYVFSLGRCRYCKKTISIRYPFVESASVLIWLINWSFFKNTIDFYFLTFFFSCLLIIIFTDLSSFFISDHVTYPLIFLGILYNYFHNNILDSFYGIFIGFSCFLMIGIIGRLFYKKNTIGGGDMKLAAGIGSYWGFKMAILSCYFSFLVGGTIGIILVLFKLKKRSDLIPFGPSIIAGFFIALFWGDWIWSTYISG